MSKLSPEEIDLLYRLEIKPALVPHFFNKLNGVKWLDALIERGYFHPDKLPKPIPDNEGYVSIPSWPALQYLVAIREELREAENVECADKVLKILRDVTKKAYENEISNYRVWWQFSKIIGYIPQDKLKFEDLELVQVWLNDQFEKGLVAAELGEKWFPQLLESSDPDVTGLAIGLLNILFKISFVERKIGSYEKIETLLTYDSWQAENIVNSVAKLAGIKLGLGAVAIFESKLILILDTLKNDSWSSLWRPAVEDHEQNKSGDDTEDIIVLALRECLLGVAESNSGDLQNQLMTWLSSDKETLKRIAIYIVTKHYTDYKSLLYLVLDKINFNSNMIHEVWQLLNQRFHEFAKEDKQRVFDIIDSIVIEDDNGAINVRGTAYRKAAWLAAIKDTDERLSVLYHDTVKLAGAEHDHPDFSSYSSCGWVGHESPIEVERLLSFSTEELIETLSNYQESGRFGEPGLEGLVNAFKNLVKNKPIEISLEFNKLAKLDLAYIYEIFEAYYALWNEKAELDWSMIWPRVLDFATLIVGQDLFWHEDAPKERINFVANRHWIVGSIARLIEDGVKDDSHAFEAELIPQATDIIILLLDRQEGQDISAGQDAVTWAINSPRGK
ncbi:MAG: hypothetical protein PHD01_11755, partial [Geobacteraceae bacterium]|nr:hypothetical protein [Geobacteraceae bacterium]